MLPAGEVGLVAVSGGADSMCLLHCLARLGCKLAVAHLDHAIRPESEADADFVREAAASLGLECIVERRAVPAYRRQRKLSLEAAAREVRHAFLREAAAKLGASAIFLGHTADDQVETFLLRLIRGAGVAGLRGMQPQEDLLCRPMLGIWRSDVEVWLREHDLEWHEDASNRDPRFLRNRVRHELLPLLASLNPGVKKVLLREADLMGDRQDEIEAELLRRLGLNARQIGAALDGKPVVLKLPPRPSQRERAGVREPSAADTTPLTLTLTRRREKAQHQPFDQPLRLPGLVHLPGIGAIRAKGVVLQGMPEASAGVEYVDLEQTGGDLRVRSRKQGDRFVPLGMSGSKKLQDFFVNEHVPRDERDRLPLVTTAGGAIVWVVGMRIDERFKVTPGTSTAVRLQFVPE
ncbi:MAG TPA: tRNA lysidine(34) synthetase TilS [Chloroflexota bacterium]